MPSSKPSYKTQEFDVLVRHHDLRKAIATKPSKGQIGNYIAIAKKRAGLFLKSQTRLCKQMGYDYDDILQYTTCWAVNFVGRFEKPDKPLRENKKLFASYLSQRFQEFSCTLQKKNRSTTSEWQPPEQEPEIPLEQALAGVPKEELHAKLQTIANSRAFSWPVRRLARELLQK